MDRTGWERNWLRPLIASSVLLLILFLVVTLGHGRSSSSVDVAFSRQQTTVSYRNSATNDQLLKLLKFSEMFQLKKGKKKKKKSGIQALENQRADAVKVVANIGLQVDSRADSVGESFASRPKSKLGIVWWSLKTEEMRDDGVWECDSIRIYRATPNGQSWHFQIQKPKDISTPVFF